MPVEMWVEEASTDASEDASYFQRSANLSRGGLYLEHGVPRAPGTRVKIRFTLPGDDAPVETAALIVKVDAAEFGTHLKFEGIAEVEVARINRYIARAQKG